LLDMTRDAELGTGDALAVILDGLAAEPEIGILGWIIEAARFAIDRLGRPAHRPARLAVLAARSRELLDRAEPGNDRQLAFARTLVDAAIDAADLARIRDWLSGRAIPEGLELGPDRRWAILTRLAVLGLVGEAEIDEEAARDSTTSGLELAARARASLPDPHAKAAAWQAITSGEGLTLGLRRSYARGFWRPEQLELTRPYVERYATDVVPLFAAGATQTARAVARGAFPATHVEPATVAAVDHLLATPSLDPSLRRILVEGRWDLLQAQRTRERDDRD